MKTFSEYRSGQNTYQVSYRRDSSNLIRSLRIMAEDDYQAAMLVRDSLLDATIIKIVKLN